MDNIIIIAVVTVIIGLAIGYIIRAKRRGVKCIGCSACNCNCTKNNNTNCGSCNGCIHNTDSL
ncbi:MAG: FeoB-associated Cys-rich membrane protein [Ruminococcaceae bacterium]|nr:FeoB-associated Cys-rich membrane protein [Oscillospiraceae bacterium]